MAKISLKNQAEIEIMKKGGHIAATILNELASVVKPGLQTVELDRLAVKLIEKAKVIASFKNFHGYPASICISLNNEVVHGIPCDREIKDGDLVKIDLGILYKGFHTDTAITVGVGKVSEKAEKLMTVTKKALQKGIEAVKPDIRLGVIQNIIQKEIERNGFGVVRDLVGHGIGKELQESPSIPNYGYENEGPILKEGMTLAIEPMVTAGDYQVKTLEDGWTVATVDKSLSSHFEHTVVITSNGAEILTKV